MRTKVEKETVVLFNEAEDRAEIYTHNARWKNRLQELSKQYPDECSPVSENADGGMTFSLDKRLVTIRKPYSEERRKKERERAIKENRIGNCRKNNENMEEM